MSNYLNNFSQLCHVSHGLGKPTICIGESKSQISFAVTGKLISTFVFATQIVQFLYFLNPKFPASNHLLSLYSPVCVGPGRNPNCWFSHAQAHVVETNNNNLSDKLIKINTLRPWHGDTTRR